MKKNEISRKSKELSSVVKNKAVILRNDGLTYKEIGEKLNISLFTVRSIIQKYKNTGTTENKKRTGRPRIFSNREKRDILREVKKNPKKSAPNLAVEFENTTGKHFSVQTLRNVLHESKFYGRAARKKPFISEVNRKKRLDFAKKYLNKPREFWESIIFSDESKFNIFGSDGRQYVWRRPNTELKRQNVVSTVKHGGGCVLVWGCMAANGVGNLTFIEGHMTAIMYIDILRSNLMDSADKLGIRDSFVFQQDNDPKHTALKTREWLLYNAPRQLKTPPQSPDVNPIENLWNHLGQAVRKHKITSKSELKRVITEEWTKISRDTTKTLVYSMDRRLQAIIDANGLHTKY